VSITKITSCDRFSEFEFYFSRLEWLNLVKSQSEDREAGVTVTFNSVLDSDYGTTTSSTKVTSSLVIEPGTDFHVCDLCSFNLSAETKRAACGLVSER
jgi:hypothetical protein